MSFMISGCSSLTSLNINGFDTKSVVYMNGLFYGCSSLKSLDVSHFETNSNIFVPKDVAQVSPYLRKIIKQKISEDKTIEETLETIVIDLKEINGDILEIVMDKKLMMF